MASIEQKVEALIEPKVNELGYNLYDVEFAKEGENYFLRVFIDKDGGIDINDCEKVNDGIMDLLDEADYIKEQYFLEVSSPGIERVLRKNKHLEESIGLEVEIKLFKTENNKKQIEGILKGFNDEEVVLLVDNETRIVQRKNISLIKTKYNWDSE